MFSLESIVVSFSYKKLSISEKMFLVFCQTDNQKVLVLSCIVIKECNLFIHFKGRSWPCILFIDKLAYVTFNVFTSLCYNGISQ